LFEREHHRRIATVLSKLDAQALAVHGCLFGGGTAMAMRYGEYRESLDMDFLVSNMQGYRALRQRLTQADGLQAIAKPGQVLNLTREMRADQYGLRTMLNADGAPIKFEIVLEARIQLEPPTDADCIEGVSTLTPLDMATSKLLANADRWRDDAMLSRDVIDLAMMAPTKTLLRKAIGKAQGAYGAAIESDLAKAISHLRDRPHRLDECMAAMGMTQLPKAVLWARIKALGKGLSKPASG
jgi:hypothetical protein